MKVQPIFDIASEHGEGPVWDAEKGHLYWVDLLQGKYHKGDLNNLEIETFSVGQPLGVLALRKEGGLVMGVRDGIGFYNEKNRAFQLIEPSPEHDNPKVRFNDGAIDPKGRFFAGTMEWDGAEDIGKLFRLNLDLSWDLLQGNIFITNGMGWNPQQDTYFMIDTMAQVMYAYDYELKTGAISNRRVHIQFGKDEFPDGMTIDREGGFWIALWGGGKIIHLDQKGKLIKEIPVPVSHPTSCCFGGPDLKTLFITSSKLPLSEVERQTCPLAGRTFVVQTEVMGQLEPKFNG